MKRYPIPPAPPDRLPREGETICKTPARKADYKIDPETGCWEWQKALHPKSGYPAAINLGKPHRVYYERAYGPVPADHDVHHKCWNRTCVNPEHLEAMHNRMHDVVTFLHSKGRDLDFVRQVRAEGRKPGARVQEVADRYGLAHVQVQNWWHGIAWGDLLGDGPVITPPNDCLNCGKVVEGTRRDKKFCDMKCYRSWYHAQRRAGHASVVVRNQSGRTHALSETEAS